MASEEIISYESYDIGKGLVLSVTNCIFGRLDSNEEGTIRYRQGSEIDTSKLSACFAGSYMNVDFIEKINARKYEMKKNIRIVKSRLKEDESYKFLIILVSSHGTSQDGRTQIFDTENNLLDVEQDLIAPFYNHKFHEFSGRPKIFIFNCCRGVMPHRFEPKHDGILSSETTACTKETYSGDMCIVWSTTDGSTSLRLSSEGSPLIQTLCNIIMEKAKSNTLSSTNFHDLLKEVQWKIKSDNRVQIVIDDRLSKPFYLSCTGSYCYYHIYFINVTKIHF